MDPERWHQIDELLQAALDRHPNEREVFVHDACSRDAALEDEVRSLLCSERQAGTFLERPVVQVAARAIVQLEPQAADDSSTSLVGQTISGYRVLEKLSEGGMGIVYRAEQNQPRRTIALKVIKPGLSAPDMLRRFELESQALGRLQHPGIAQIYEAGTADTGFGPQPYLAMELILGQPLITYAEMHELNTRQRLEIMAKVCEAVHHAHQRGIIHRDLKPVNILVDESGQPKVLDFGIARLTDSDVYATRRTDLGQVVGTLAYMSPEQVLGDPQELDTRSDVYALGVILFELLAGRLPYRISRQLHQAVQAIREEDPARLGSVSRAYRGDIETIVAKALEKEKSRRYTSAAGMAGDIRRYLEDEPIIARPPSAPYQLRKFARRHRALVAGITAVFVVLITGIIASTSEATRARRAEQEAKTQAAIAEAVTEFLQNDVLAQTSPYNQVIPHAKPDPDLKLRTALDRASAHIAGKFEKQPLVEAAIRQTIGDTYDDLGLYPQAQRQLERVLSLRRRVFGDRHPDTLDALSSLARLEFAWDNYGQAEPLFVKLLGLEQRILGREHPKTLGTMVMLGALYNCQGKYDQAQPLLIRALEMCRRILGEGDPATLEAMNDLGASYAFQGSNALAKPLLRTTLELRTHVLGNQNPDTLNTMENLALVYLNEHNYPEAERLYFKRLALSRQALGNEHPLTLESITRLGEIYDFEGKYAQAQPLLREGFEEYERGDFDTWYRYRCQSLLGASLAARGKYRQAEPLLISGYEGMRKRETQIPAYLKNRLQRSADWIVRLYRDWGKPEKAAEWAHRLPVLISDARPNRTVAVTAEVSLKKIPTR